jgi:peptidoglycan/xylan/chitin deacetylase (PgdA/CDA1 family)
MHTRKFFLSLILIIMPISLLACQSANGTETILVTSSPTIPATIAASPTQPDAITNTATIAVVPTIIPTSALTPTPLPIMRHTPPTLMLHRNNANFDSVQFLKDMIAILKENNLRVITYRDITNSPEITVAEQGHLFIITIDDIYLQYPIDLSVKEMIAVLQEAGFPAVLGVVTEGDYIDKETAQTLKELSAQGWDIATHTDEHRNLGEMEKTMPRTIYLELKTSMDKIERAIGVRPITLVLPEGQMVTDSKQLIRAGLLWAVGINGGVQYNTTRDIYYVGREGPDGSAALTFEFMLKRFNP